MERLQKVIAASGVASRRKAEELILAKKVMVNGQVVSDLGVKVSDKDIILVNGEKISKEEKVYYALNKPSGYVTTVSDEFDRKTVLDLFLPEDLEKRIFPIGRLDYDTQGILLLTNDGELANKLISPASHVEKEYLARVEGKVNEAALAKLKRGVVIDGYKTLPADVYVREYNKATNSSLVDITIVEGKNHQVKKMCEAVGFPVKRLTRIRFGCISTEGLGKGNYRKLKIHEVKKLYGL
jgi:23S rRNA pseudouridine2605 synthase